MPTAIRIDLDELLIGETATFFRIESGDTIYIPQAPHFFVYGEVERVASASLSAEAVMVSGVGVKR